MDELKFQAPNESYEKFFTKFNEINNLNINNWNTTHLLGYFCKKYQEVYKINYQFKFNTTAPSKSFEVFHMKRLMIQLSSNPEIIKEYIDWVFLHKVPKAKRRLTSISFLTNEETVNYYKMNMLFTRNTITRTTILPDKYKICFADTKFKPDTYGDLAFLNQMMSMPEDLQNAFNKLRSTEFDFSWLEKVV